MTSTLSSAHLKLFCERIFVELYVYTRIELFFNVFIVTQGTEPTSLPYLLDVICNILYLIIHYLL